MGRQGDLALLPRQHRAAAVALVVGDREALLLTDGERTVQRPSRARPIGRAGKRCPAQAVDLYQCAHRLHDLIPVLFYKAVDLLLQFLIQHGDPPQAMLLRLLFYRPARKPRRRDVGIALAVYRLL